MRVHTLRVTAFGPFAGTVDVDVDTLSEHGLFLLTGPTGAGKTSVLDAICFGLFGQVPGARQHADRLRSDHADPSLAPEVRIDVTLGGRRLLVTRSPRWLRPSSRARSGSVTQHARVLLQERAGGGWETLTTRIDEAQLLLDGLLGMTVGQFTQVAMLPQGQFQDFLRAGADERRTLLERLFGTQRFGDVERWLAERRSRARAAAEAAGRAACSAADQLHGAAHLTEPVPADPTDWPTWAALVADGTRRRRDDLSVLVGQSGDVLEVARRHHRAGVELAAARRSGELALQRLADVDATRAEADELAATLRSAERAREVMAHLEPLADATAQNEAAQVQTAASLADVAELLPDVVAEVSGDLTGAGLAELQRCQAALEAARAGTERAVERELRLAADVTRLTTLEAAVAAAEGAAAKTEQVAAGLRDAAAAAPAAIAALRASIGADQRLDATHDHLALAVPAARRQAEAADLLPVAERRLRAAETAAREAFAAYLTAADARLTVSRRRLAGAAAELARGLVGGAPCTVCGSTTHPAPAAPDDDHADESAEITAQQHETAAEKRRADADALVVEVGGEVARLRAAAGDHTPAETAAAVDELTAQLSAAAAARARLPESQSRLAEAEQDQRLAAERLDSSVRRSCALAAEVAAGRTAASDLRSGLVDALGDGLDIDGCQGHTRRCGEVVGAALTAVTELCSARTVHAAARQRADRSARRHGFADAESAQSAALDEATREQLHGGLERRRRQADRDAEVLADPQVVAALAAATPDLDALAAAERSAEQLHDGHRGDLSTAQHSAARLDELSAALSSRLAEWQPLRRTQEVTAGLAALAEGKSGDNTLHMSLSSYVLAARLEQVVAAANERLVPMTSGRYALEHTVDKTAGDRRAAAGGLGLRVRDEWTGEVREPSTLSGGETFQASLALALGLADVVGYECGGTQLQTIFVDEGFGSLDADSLDEVMDELDRLRDGGRVVGVVSHVDAVRERIPAQLRLVKTRTGSAIASAS